MQPNKHNSEKKDNLNIKVNVQQNKWNKAVGTNFEFLEFFNAYVSWNLVTSPELV